MRFITWLPVLILSACASSNPAQLTSTPVQRTVAVDPAEIQGYQSYEFGELVKLLMPKENETFNWAWRDDAEIYWQKGLTHAERGRNGATRFGKVRVNVLGVKSTVLNRAKEELGWSVDLYTEMPVKFGPEEIHIVPGSSTAGDQCFGVGFEGCDFDPKPSLEKAGIQLKKICERVIDTTNYTRAYLLTSPGKMPVVGTESQSLGSGGGSTEFVMHPKASPEYFCKELAKPT